MSVMFTPEVFKVYVLQVSECLKADAVSHFPAPNWLMVLVAGPPIFS